jgi:hypothetical protein
MFCQDCGYITCIDSCYSVIDEKKCLKCYRKMMYDLYKMCKSKKELLYYLQIKKIYCLSFYQQIKFKCRILSYLLNKEKKDLKVIEKILDYLSEYEKKQIIITHKYNLNIYHLDLSLEENILKSRKSINIKLDKIDIDNNKYIKGKCCCKYCYDYNYHDYSIENECVCKTCVYNYNLKNVVSNIKEFNECSICYNNEYKYNKLIHCKSCVNTVCILCLYKYKQSGRTNWNFCPCCKTILGNKYILNNFLLKEKKNIMEELFNHFLENN